MKKWQIAVVVVVIVAVAVGGFFGGRASAGSKTPTVQEAMQVLQKQFQQGGGNGYGFPGGANGATGANGTLRRGNAVSGSIIAADNGSITVKTSDGGTKMVLVSSSTTVSKVSEGSLSDLATGQNVIVTGTTNNDGSVTATRIQVGAVVTTNGTGGAAPSGDAGGPPPGGGAAPGGAGSAGSTPGGGSAPAGGGASSSSGGAPAGGGAAGAPPAN